MNFVDSTKSYEAWLAKRTRLVKEDLALKHDRMREELFPFFRATYYRWAQTFPTLCPDCARDVQVLAVGDLHVDNFGTWRDVDGRLVWGINDFDECHPLPFTHDLVRLATSGCLAIDAGQLEIAPKAGAAALLDGYRACLDTGGQPLILADESTPLRVMARERLNTPERFWKKLLAHPPSKGPVPAAATRLIEELLPDKKAPLRFLHRAAGMGSLGKERFTAVGTWLGGQIAREAKALTPSACYWAEGKKDGAILYGKILERAVRCPDPLVRAQGNWLGRRLSPDCFRIELTILPAKRDETELLYSMGWETANIHLGSASAAKLAASLKRKSSHWLHQMAKAMRDQTIADWKDWRRKGT